MKRQPSPKKDRVMQFPGFDSNHYLLLVIFQTFWADLRSGARARKPVSDRHGLLHLVVKAIARLFKRSRRAKKEKPGDPQNVASLDDHRCRLRGRGKGPDCGCPEPVAEACVMGSDRKVV